MAVVQDGCNRIPIVATILKGHPHIPIRKTIITLEYFGDSFSFLLAYRFHRLFLRNKGLRGIDWDVVGSRDMVVCRLGVNHSYVNLSMGHERMAMLQAVSW
ncbi:hypothetical protein L208DRAFT_1287897 [Tricholoma matsutake]|nr:hypothetical protein L208DRAFT_1287897 [Tricholoma matsutake 945]